MYSRILVPLDGSPTASLGLNEAIKLAKALNANIRIMHVIEAFSVLSLAPEGVDYSGVLEALRTGGQVLLTEAQARASRAGVEVDTALIEAVSENTGACVVDKAREWHADLIVCGTHGRRGVQRLLMGSDAEYILRHSPVPVLLIREPDHNEGRQRAA